MLCSFPLFSADVAFKAVVHHVEINMSASMTMGMAGMMRPQLMVSLCRQSRLGHGLRHTVVLAARSQSTVPAAEQISEEVEYPPVKPKFPPGRWSPHTPKRAWLIYNEGQELLQIPTVKHRLEKLAGPWDRTTKPVFYDMRFQSVVPGTLPLNQYVTKTHIAAGLPPVYDRLNADPRLGQAFDRLRPLLLEAVQEEQYRLPIITGKDRSKLTTVSQLSAQSMKVRRMVARLLNIILAGLSADFPHLLRSQFDESARVETFWRRTGYERDCEKCVHGIFWQNCINFQTKYIADYQVRTEVPLPEFVPLEDPVCQEGEVPDVRYSPRVSGCKIARDRPLSVSGHWIGDPCEFGHLSVNMMKYPEEWKEKGYLDEESLAWAVIGGFGWTASQAYNQGFNTYHDVTYPFTSQLVLTDGQWFRFFSYQLNTLHLWKDDEGNPLRNILWASPRLSLFDVIEDGQVKGLNDDVLKHLVRCLMLEPEDRGMNLRPYLPEEEAPVAINRYINDKDTPHLSYHKLGRYELPRYSVYF